jgi:hypothetical protein
MPDEFKLIGFFAGAGLGLLSAPGAYIDEWCSVQLQRAPYVTLCPLCRTVSTTIRVQSNQASTSLTRPLHWTHRALRPRQSSRRQPPSIRRLSKTQLSQARSATGSLRSLTSLRAVCIETVI